jgi:hypothetical protein
LARNTAAIAAAASRQTRTWLPSKTTNWSGKATRGVLGKGMWKSVRNSTGLRRNSGSICVSFQTGARLYASSAIAKVLRSRVHANIADLYRPRSEGVVPEEPPKSNKPLT